MVVLQVVGLLFAAWEDMEADLEARVESGAQSRGGLTLRLT